VSPGEQAELFNVVLLHQREDKPNETDDVQGEGQEAMIGHQELKVFLYNTFQINSCIVYFADYALTTRLMTTPK